MLSKRQQQIIETSLELISSKGIQGFTIKNLSKEIGISEPAIYRHFDCKIHILTSTLEYFKSKKNLLFDENNFDVDNSIAKIQELFTNHFIIFSETPTMASVVFSEEIFRNEKVLTDKIKEIIKHNNNVLIDIINKGQEKNEIRNDIESKDLALMLMGMLRLLIKNWQFENFTFNLNKRGEDITLMIEKILKI